MSNTMVIFIMSQGHAGSTLLGLILGSHPEIFGLGELARFEYHLPTICGICQGSCQYWKEKASLPILQRHFSRSWGFRTIPREIYRYHRSIYSYLADWFGYSIFVDSSKSPDWIRGQLRYRRNWHSMAPFLIHLTRDGRAVINSFLRKFPNLDIETFTARWIRSTSRQLKLYEEFDGPKINIAYESLASSPEEKVRKLCEFLGVEYFPDMLRYWQHEHHQIGGNTGARSLISDGKNKDGNTKTVKAGDWHDGYYQDMGKTIKLDLRWKWELPPEYQEYFDRHAGALNRKFSFDETEP